VERRSLGDVYYVLAILLLFLALRHRPVFYLIAVLVLVISDTLAALLGAAYGRWTYAVEADRRSLEGSTVFFLATLLAVHLPLLLLTGIDRAASVLIGLQLALLVTCFEAISLGGIDNLVVPLVTGYLLVKMTPYPAAWIAGQLALELGILALMGLIAWWSRVLTFSGAVAAHLFFYGALALGGLHWLVAPGLALGLFLLVWRVTHRDPAAANPVYQVLAVFYVGIVGVALFVANNALAMFVPEAVPAEGGLRDPLYVPFAGVMAGQLGIVAYVQLLGPPRRRLTGSGGRAQAPAMSLVLSPPGAIAAAAAAAALIVLLSLAFGPKGLDLRHLGTAALIGLGSLLLYTAARRFTRWPPGETWDLRLQAASVAAMTAATLPVYLLRFHAG
jgi:hypothetical protein